MLDGARQLDLPLYRHNLRNNSSVDVADKSRVLENGKEIRLGRTFYLLSIVMPD